MASTPPRRPLAPWQAGLVFLVAAGLEIGLGYAVVLACSVGARAAGEDAAAWITSPPAIAVQVLLGSALLAAVALITARARRLDPAAALRLRPCRGAAIAVAAIGVAPLGILADEATFAAHSLAPGAFPADALARFGDAFAAAPTAWFVALTAIVAVAPALGEELLFRGLVLGALVERLPRALAALLTALLFGAIHFNALQGLGAALIGLYLAYAVLATGSLWPAIAAHALNNALSALLARLDPGGMGSAYAGGHPWPLVATAAVAAAVAVLALPRLGRAGAQSS